MQIPIIDADKGETKRVFQVYKPKVKPQAARVTWDRVHDEYLGRMVEQFERKNWKQIAAEMKQKYPDLPINGKKCRERWITSIKEGINRLPLSETEDVMLILHHHTYSNRWSTIAKKMPMRNSSCLKNNFYSLLKKIIRQVLLHSQGQLLEDVPPTQFYSAIYVCVMLVDLMENEGKLAEVQSASGVSRTPPHILDFVHTLKVTPSMCKTYLVSLKFSFLASCQALTEPARHLLQSADFGGLGQFFEETALLVPSLLSVLNPDQVVCAAFAKAAVNRTLRLGALSPAFGFIGTPPTAIASGQPPPIPSFASNTPQRMEPLPLFLKPFVEQRCPHMCRKRSFACLGSFPWPNTF